MVANVGPRHGNQRNFHEELCYATNPFHFGKLALGRKPHNQSDHLEQLPTRLFFTFQTSSLCRWSSGSAIFQIAPAHSRLPVRPSFCAPPFETAGRLHHRTEVVVDTAPSPTGHATKHFPKPTLPNPTSSTLIADDQCCAGLPDSHQVGCRIIQSIGFAFTWRHLNWFNWAGSQPLQAASRLSNGGDISSSHGGTVILIPRFLPQEPRQEPRFEAPRKQTPA